MKMKNEKKKIYCTVLWKTLSRNAFDKLNLVCLALLYVCCVTMDDFQFKAKSSTFLSEAHIPRCQAIIPFR